MTATLYATTNHAKRARETRPILEMLAGVALIGPGLSASFEIDPLDWVRHVPYLHLGSFVPILDETVVRERSLHNW